MDEAGHQAVRLIIASYFIAIAVGVLPSENGRALMTTVLPEQYAVAAVSGFVFFTAFLILVGRQMRLAALLLANYVFWSSLVANFVAAGQINIVEFWRDLVMVAALMLTYTGPALPRRRLLRFGRRVTPRRIVPSRSEQRRISADALREQIRAEAKQDLPTPIAIVGTHQPGTNGKARNGKDERNLFADIFDAR
ncbi:hypothetical protein PSA7680_00570 [Pseudoruegeria aquimaris]|uniref:DoxX n=1 Tax=Pseudoruegeria aquimaris TaxID=393663 RepID=A0A1Y5RHU5_9RHOB|nr:hypothetical protein [Pseudoruegeria aquimaris]SLN17841.1 hypothetical protein PSA7680_00570 [Pseudoruegeria aquimaris]